MANITTFLELNARGNWADVLKDVQKQTTRSKNSTEALIQKLKDQNQQLEVGSRMYALLKARREGATMAQVKEIRTLMMANDALKNVNGGFNNQRRELRQAGGMWGQLGHQIQDVVVTMQMGMPIGMIFAQQGSQIASIMGGRGAMYGAVLAIVGALSTYIWSMKNAGKTTEELAKITEEAEEAVKNYAKEVEHLTEAQRTNLALQMLAQYEAQLEKLEGLRTAEQEAAQAIREHNAALATQKMMLGESSQGAQLLAAALHFFKEDEKDLTKYGRTLGKTAGNIQLVETEASRLLNIYTQLMQGKNPFYEGEKGSDKLAESIEKTIEKLWDEYETYGMSEAQITAYNLAKQGATQATIDEAVELVRARQELERDLELRKEKNKELQKQAEAQDRLAKQAAAKALREAEKFQGEGFSEAQGISTQFDSIQQQYMTEQELLRQHEQAKLDIVNEALARGMTDAKTAADLKAKITAQGMQAEKAIVMQGQMAVANSAMQSLSTLSAVFDKSSAIGKAAFVASQGLNVALTIMNTEAAATAALAPPPIGMGPIAGIPYSTGIRALGYAAAGAIMGQTLASFEGGGFTGNSVRSGGIDGHGGYLSVLHGNEVVTDLHKGQGGAANNVNVSFNISAVDARGIDSLLAERRGMITSMVAKALANEGRRL